MQLLWDILMRYIMRMSGGAHERFSQPGEFFVNFR
jgi:hypothetical protein